MAKYLDKDPDIYARERDGFLRDLQHFHETRGTPFRRAPKLAGQEIDLFLLYSLVTGRGGWIKVNYRNQWTELFEPLHIPTCVNASIALKQIYLRYLDRWEKLNYMGGEEQDRGGEEDEESRHKRWSARSLHSVPLSYNYNQHIIADSAREYNHLSTTLYKPSDYDRLALSLLSPLPNEQDFAINVCTLLSNDGKHTLKLDRHPRILDYLLAHAGVFNHGSLRSLFTDCYLNTRKQSIHNFWQDALESDEYLDLATEPSSSTSTSTSTQPSPHTTTSELPGGNQHYNYNTYNTPSKDVNDNTKLTAAVEASAPMIGVNTENSSLGLKSVLLLGGASNSNTRRRERLTQFSTESEDESDNNISENSDDESEELFAPSDEDSELVESGGGSRERTKRRKRRKRRRSSVRDGSELGDEFCGGEKRRWVVEKSDRELFNLGRNLGTRDYMGQRVLQIATILRNLTFIEENVPVLSTSRPFIRFSLLCSAARWNQLHNLGLDMLCNMSSELLVRDVLVDRLPSAVLRLVCGGLQTEDRNWCICALEVLNKLSQNEKNEDMLLRVLEGDVYRRVTSFLTIHDVMLLVYTLECLYSLSSLGERSCNFIVSNYGVVDTLVSLVTVEGKSYGPKACIGMKLVETVTNSTTTSTNMPAPSTTNSNNITTPIPTTPSLSTTTTTNNNSTSPAVVGSSNTGIVMVGSGTSGGVAAPVATPVPLSSPPPSVSGGSLVTPSRIGLGGMVTPARVVPIAPHRLVNVTTGSNKDVVAGGSTSVLTAVPPTPITPSKTSAPTTITTLTSTPSNTTTSPSPILTTQHLVQQQHAHQQAIQENEQFALTWLRTTYEPSALGSSTVLVHGQGGRVEAQELYKHYINSCAKIGRRGVIAPLHFPRCVRSVFGGTVGPNPVKPAASESQYYDGIKVRPVPLLQSPPSKSTTTATKPTTTPSKLINTSSKTITITPTKPIPITIAQTTTTSTTNSVARRLIPSSLPPSVTNLVPVTLPSSAVLETAGGGGGVNPISPILKAQLSAPPKQPATTGGNATSPGSYVTVVTASDLLTKSQVKAHPHLSQALMGSGCANPVTVTSVTSANATVTTMTTASAVTSQGQSNTSLIKSLLATKVNECMPGMKTDCQSVAQVAARQQQQRLLAQQQSTPPNKSSNPSDTNHSTTTPKSSRINGVRQLFAGSTVPDNTSDKDHLGDAAVSSTTTLTTSRREPPQPPPPPLQPILVVNNNNNSGKGTIVTQRVVRIENEEDSDSLGNNSLASSSGIGNVGIGGVSSTEDGENSLTSFEGLLNGTGGTTPATCILTNEDSNASSKDSAITTNLTNVKQQQQKPLMLADLLEKKVLDKDPPPIVMNGVLGKELRLGDRGLQLVENHLDRVLLASGKEDMEVAAVINEGTVTVIGKGVKRPASEDPTMETEAKKPHLTTQAASTLNGNSVSPQHSPAGPDSVSSSSNGAASNSSSTTGVNPEEMTTSSSQKPTVSNAAAKLFADMAADIMLDDDEEEENMQETGRQQQVQQQVQQQQQQQQMQQQLQQQQQQQQNQQQTQQQLVQQVQQQVQQQVIMQQQQAPRQIIVNQGQGIVGTVAGGGMTVLPAGTQLKTQSGQTVIVQNAQATAGRQMIMQQGSTGQIVLSQSGQMQLVTSSAGGPLLTTSHHPQQYVIQTSGGHHHGTPNFVMAQPQQAVVHGQQQTVLVAGGGVTGGGAGTKTIIILQQGAGGMAGLGNQQLQKVVMTPHGQQMVVTTRQPQQQLLPAQNQQQVVVSSCGTTVMIPANSTFVNSVRTIAPVPSAVLTNTNTIITSGSIPSIQSMSTTTSANSTNSSTTKSSSSTNNSGSVILNNNTTTTTNASASASSSNVASSSSTSSSGVTVYTSASGIKTSTNVSVGKMVGEKKAIGGTVVDNKSKVIEATTTVATSSGTSTVTVTTPKRKIRDVTTLYVCEWADCHIEKRFRSANQVFMHVCETHCIDTTEEMTCLWERCDTMKRKRFSLMTHIQDKHCTIEAMKASLLKRKQQQHSTKAEPVTVAPPIQQHPGYAPDAAFHAIKRHALEFVNPKELQRNGNSGMKQVTPAIALLPRACPPLVSDQDDNEGPVTKSIRLTASLILRNLVIYSTNCRRYLKPYEPHLANVALSNVESSRTIAQVLYDMNDTATLGHHHHR